MRNPTVIIQARTGSERLPGKVLLPLPMSDPAKNILYHVYARASAAPEVGRTVVATTQAAEDDAIASWAEKNGVCCFRGSGEDVLDRYYQAAVRYEASDIVRITSDCPCIDSGVLSAMWKAYENAGADYLSNTLERSFARGLDVEIFSFRALERAWREAEGGPCREHVTLYMYQSGKFRCVNYRDPHAREGDKDIRVTVDTRQDYAAVCAVYDLLGESFSYRDLLALLAKYGWIKLINAGVAQKKTYGTYEEEVTAAAAFLAKQGMTRAAEALLNISGGR